MKQQVATFFLSISNSEDNKMGDKKQSFFKSISTHKPDYFGQMALFAFKLFKNHLSAKHS